MNKKMLVSVFVFVLSVSGVFAQNVSVSGEAVVPPTVIAFPPIPPKPMPVPPASGNDIMQFNNLTIESVSAQIPPAEIIASNGIYYLQGSGEQTPAKIYSLSQAQSGGTSGAAPPSGKSDTKCYIFADRASNSGRLTECPQPPKTENPAAQTANPAQQPQTTNSNAPPAAIDGSSAIYPNPCVDCQTRYRIKVSVETKLYLRDRRPATLSEFQAGDQINVFGMYGSDGSIEALIVRNLSRPVEKSFVQLNNVELVSVSGGVIPAELVVMQRQIHPCYYFDGPEGAKKQSVCPRGIRQSDDSRLRAMKPPLNFMPIWDTARKYVVRVDGQTILLNRERARLNLSELKIGDKLNVYGETTGDGAVIDADIVRDLSQPMVAQNYSGTVTQVNTDGSFVIRAESGEVFTVQNPIKVGAIVKLKGLLDELQKLISQVSEITIRNDLHPVDRLTECDCAAPPFGCNYDGKRTPTSCCGALICGVQPLPFVQ